MYGRHSLIEVTRFCSFVLLFTQIKSVLFIITPVCGYIYVLFHSESASQFGMFLSLAVFQPEEFE